MELNSIDVISFIVALLLLALLYWVGKAYLRWKKIKDIADSIKSSKFEAILDAISSIGDVQPTAALLIKQSTESDANVYSLFIPPFLENAWAGKSIRFEIEGNLEIRLVEGMGESWLGKTKFRELPAPRVKLKNGKEQNIWSCQRYLSRSSNLNALLKPVAESDRAEALEYILGPSVRVCGGIEWVQGAEYPKCKECRGKMKFVLQVAGAWFPKKLDFDVHESEIYIFSCEKHPTQVEKVVQFY